MIEVKAQKCKKQYKSLSLSFSLDERQEIEKKLYSE